MVVLALLVGQVMSSDHSDKMPKGHKSLGLNTPGTGKKTRGGGGGG